MKNIAILSRKTTRDFRLPNFEVYRYKLGASKQQLVPSPPKTWKTWKTCSKATIMATSTSTSTKKIKSFCCQERNRKIVHQLEPRQLPLCLSAGTKPRSDWIQIDGELPPRPPLKYTEVGWRRNSKNKPWKSLPPFQKCRFLVDDDKSLLKYWWFRNQTKNGGQGLPGIYSRCSFPKIWCLTQSKRRNLGTCTFEPFGSEEINPCFFLMHPFLG